MCKKILTSGTYCKRAVVAFGFCRSHIPEDIKIECCICYSKSNCYNVLKCDHCVCASCVNQLRDDKCPVCRARLEGKNITGKVMKKIELRKKEDKQSRESYIDINDITVTDDTQLFNFLSLLMLNSPSETELEFHEDELINYFVIISAP